MNWGPVFDLQSMSELKVTDRADDVQHALMLRLLFQTAVRVSELCGIQIGDIDIESHKIRLNGGKGDKDRFVLFGKSFATALRTHIEAYPNNRWLFQTRRNSRYTTRRVPQIVKLFAEQAGVTATPHNLRHQCITWLTRHSRTEPLLRPVRHPGVAGNAVPASWLVSFAVLWRFGPGASGAYRCRGHGRATAVGHRLPHVPVKVAIRGARSAAGRCRGRDPLRLGGPGARTRSPQEELFQYQPGPD